MPANPAAFHSSVEVAASHGCRSTESETAKAIAIAGDAHGAGRKRYRPAERHAALAVNLAGSMALFLIETHEARD